MSKRISITLFARGKHAGYYSMEKVFQAVEQALPAHINARLVTSPVHAQGFWRRLFCIAYAATKSSSVNHITGDISFIAAGLPGKRTMVTIHDFDRLYRISGIRAALFRIIYFELPLRRCQCVTTISPQIAKEMERLFPWVMPKVAIVPDCLPAGFDRVPKEFQSERPVILQIGTKPNKNLERLVSAIEGLKCKLHIVGPLSGQQRSQLEQGGVTYQNSVDVSEGDLRRAYAEADIVSFVSTYEGFGLPILEANAVGRPVVTSNVPPMPEVAGQAACLVDPLSVPSIRQGLLRVIGDPNYRAELVTHGLENIKRYSAGQVARQYAALYEGLAAGCLVARHHPDGAVETI